MKHDEDLLECGLEKRGVFPEFLAFNEPVGIFVPDEVVDEIACLCKAIVLDELLELFVGLIDLFANPIFAKVL